MPASSAPASPVPDHEEVDEIIDDGEEEHVESEDAVGESEVEAAPKTKRKAAPRTTKKPVIKAKAAKPATKAKKSKAAEKAAAAGHPSWKDMVKVRFTLLRLPSSGHSSVIVGVHRCKQGPSPRGCLQGYIEEGQSYVLWPPSSRLTHVSCSTSRRPTTSR